MGLNEREYRCDNYGCGVINDRDLNASINLRDYGVFILNQLGTASAEVKPAEIVALGGAHAPLKLRSMKQESQSGHICSLRK